MKIAGLEEQLDAEKEAHAALKKKYEDASNELSKLKSELDSSKKLLADKGAGVERLDALLRELAAAKLDDPAFRKEFLSAITDEPMLQPAGVLRLIKVFCLPSACCAPTSPTSLSACPAHSESRLANDLLSGCVRAG
eukprot:395040-Rhodomonas_salina.1